MLKILSGSLMAKFHFCTKLTATPDKAVYVSDIPNEGDIVYQGGIPIRLTEKIGDGGEGIVYKTNKSENVVAKIYYNKKLTSHKQSKIEKIIAAGLSIDGVCFPLARLHNSKSLFVGYLMPKAEGVKLGTSVFRGEKGMTRFFGTWTRSDLVSLAITILYTIKKIHDLGILIGDINGLNILVKSPTKVFFVDTDSFQINEYPCPVGTSDFTAPEIQGKDYKFFMRSIGNENFAIAVLLFKLLMFGESPYAQHGGSGIEHNIKTGDFSFPFNGKSNNKMPNGDWGYFWSHLPVELQELFYRTFKKGESMYDERMRPGVEVWLKELTIYLRQLNDGTLKKIDIDSVMLFPKTVFDPNRPKFISFKDCCRSEAERRLIKREIDIWKCIKMYYFQRVVHSDGDSSNMRNLKAFLEDLSILVNVYTVDMSRIGVVVSRKYANLSKDDVFYRERMFILRWTNGSLPFAPSFKELAEIYDYPLAQYVINLPKERQIDGCHFEGLSFPVQLTFIVDHLLTY